MLANQSDGTSILVIPDDLSIPDFLKHDGTISGPIALVPLPETSRSNLTDRDRAAIADIVKGQTGTKQIKDHNRIDKMLTKKADKEAVTEGKRWDQQTGKWVDGKDGPHK